MDYTEKDLNKFKLAELANLSTRYQLTVHGTGNKGRVLKSDYIHAILNRHVTQQPLQPILEPQELPPDVLPQIVSYLPLTLARSINQQTYQLNNPRYIDYLRNIIYQTIKQFYPTRTFLHEEQYHLIKKLSMSRLQYLVYMSKLIEYNYIALMNINTFKLASFRYLIGTNLDISLYPSHYAEDNILPIYGSTNTSLKTLILDFIDRHFDILDYKDMVDLNIRLGSKYRSFSSFKKYQGRTLDKLNDEMLNFLYETIQMIRNKLLVYYGSYIPRFVFINDHLVLLDK